MGLKKAIAASLVLPTIMTFSGCGNKKQVEKQQNKIGYEDINLHYDSKVKEENFVLFNVGDHDTVKTYKQDKKMRKCNKHDISFGIIIDSDAKTQDEIYKDVDYAKSIVEKYDVDFPVYLNIDNIIESKSLMPDVMIRLINDFLLKCSTNGMFVGVTGKDSNLIRLANYGEQTGSFNIGDYDVYLIKESKKVRFTGNYTIVKQLNGKIKNKKPGYNCNPIIKNESFNNKSSFVADSTYVVKEDDELQNLAFEFGLSVKELLDYNGIKEKDFIPGLKIIIPSSIASNLSKESSNYEFKKLDKPLLGIDISHWQVPNTINWNDVAKKVDFVIIRDGHGLTSDRHFESHYKNCIQRNIPVGMYHYNDISHNDNFEEFKREVSNQSDFAMSRIKDKKFDYPLYFDLENSSLLDIRLSEFTTKEIDYMIKDWKQKVLKHGYVPGLYCSESAYKNYIKDKVNLEGIELWIAGCSKRGNYYLNIHTYDEIVKEQPNHFENSYDMHQSTSKGENFGIKSHVDVDLSYVDYTKKEQKESTKYEDSKDNNYNHKFERDALQTMYDSSPFGVTLLAGAGIYTLLKRKKRRK